MRPVATSTLTLAKHCCAVLLPTLLATAVQFLPCRATARWTRWPSKGGEYACGVDPVTLLNDETLRLVIGIDFQQLVNRRYLADEHLGFAQVVGKWREARRG